MKYWNVVKKIFDTQMNTELGVRYCKIDDNIWFLDGASGWRFKSNPGEKFIPEECIFDLSKFDEFDASMMFNITGDFEDVTARVKDDRYKKMIKLETENKHAYFREDLLKVFDKNDKFKLAECEFKKDVQMLYVFEDDEMVAFVLPVQVLERK